MSHWKPQRYLKFAQQRLRPALDLLRSITMKNTPRTILDLGCGTGNITSHLNRRWPKAEIIGVDSSEDMLATAKKENESLVKRKLARFVQGDISNFKPPKKVDLIFSNAAFHWIPDHNSLFNRLLEHLNPKGTLAFQIPDTRKQSSHLLMLMAARNVGLYDKIQNVRIPRCEHDPERYFDILISKFTDLDLWTTTYCQQLERRIPNLTNNVKYHPVTEYTQSTGLQPVLNALRGEESPDGIKFMTEYDRLITKRYPLAIGNTVLFPFTRFFCVASAIRDHSKE